MESKVTKWTPGPWEAKAGFTGNVRKLFVVAPGEDGIRPWTNEDAQLMAAAPDLYEALEAILTPGLPDHLVVKAWAALAKARGEKPDAT